MTIMAQNSRIGMDKTEIVVKECYWLIFKYLYQFRELTKLIWRRKKWEWINVL